MADRLFTRACLSDAQTHTESLSAACRALEQRIALWDAVSEALG
jgi:hypothetical protein